MECETPLATLRRCTKSRSFEEGRIVHEKLLSTGLDRNTLLGNALVQMYSKCGNLTDAHAAFERIDLKNTFTWSLLITGYAQNGNPLEALKLHQQMDLEGIKDDAYVLSSLIASCCKLGELNCGRTLHERATSCGMMDFVMENSLLNLYSKCGCFLDAKQIFDEMPKRDVISWNAMLTAFAQMGHYQDGLELFSTMDVDPNSITFVLVLGMCSTLRDLRDVHARSLVAGMEREVEVQNVIISMYARCGSLVEARAVFDNMQCKDLVSWNTILSSYLQHEDPREVLKLHMKMQHEGWKPDAFTLCSVFGACSTLGDLAYGQGVLESIEATFETWRNGTIVETAAFDMYAKCGSLEVARTMFDGMSERDSVSWSAMIAAYTQYAQPQKALNLYYRMCLEGLSPDKYTFSSTIAACGELRALQQGKMIHSRIAFEGLELGLVVGTALVDLYAKSGDVELARSVFDRMEKCKNPVPWNALLAGYLLQGRDKQVIELFNEMEMSLGEVSEPAVASVLTSYINLSLETEARNLLARLTETGLETSTVVGTTIIVMQASFSSLDEAKVAFERVKVKDNICWNAMLAAYARLGHYDEAIRHFQEGCVQGVLVPNSLTLTSLLNACSHSGLLERGREAFLMFIEDHGVQPNTDNFHCIADLMARSGRTSEAEDVINGMPFQPEAFSWNTLLSACALHNDSTRGQRAAGEIIKMPRGESAPYVLLSNLCRQNL